MTLSKLAPRLHAAGQVEAGVREPSCPVEAAQAAGAARAGGFQYSAAVTAQPGWEIERARFAARMLRHSRSAGREYQ